MELDLEHKFATRPGTRRAIEAREAAANAQWARTQRWNKNEDRKVALSGLDVIDRGILQHAERWHDLPQPKLLRTVEDQKLRFIEDLLWRTAHASHPLVRGGSILLDPTTGDPLEDPAPVLEAIRLLLSASARRARLQGLDIAPTTIVSEITTETVEKAIHHRKVEIERFHAELAVDEVATPRGKTRQQGAPSLEPGDRL
jgi:hypothetical protein